MSFFFHWKWKWHEKGKNCFKGNMVKSELCWILFDKMKLRRNRNYVENEFSCGVCWNSVVYFFLYKCKIKANYIKCKISRIWYIIYPEECQKQRFFASRALCKRIKESRIPWPRYTFIFSYSNIACKSMGGNGLRFYGLSVSGMRSRCT